MIIDSIENISKYSYLIPEDVLEFIKNLNADIEEKRHPLKGANFANVDVYDPKPIEQCKFEVHKKYIDIQILSEGEEEIDITNIEDLEISENYDAERDIMFFKKPQKSYDRIILTPHKFVLIYPYEAHQPQVRTTCNRVKKVVCKVEMKG